MQYNVDKNFILDCFKKVVETPSPTGYYVKLNPVIKQMANELGYDMTFDNKSTAYITIKGQDTSKTVLVGAHADTLGMVVRGVTPNGWLKIRKIGGLNLSSVEGETVIVHTREGKEYSGLVICKSHSVH
ncbi:MAG: peptidase M42, partial [Clostridia bacterium]|nr:peptidase M42 [Clostridia bacterium]